jgi:hypothetical protein
MIDLKQLMDAGIVLGVVATLTGLFYTYYTNDKVRSVVNKILPFLPAIFYFAASKAKDKRGVFDSHDALMVLARVTERVHASLKNPANANFEDVQDDIASIVDEELNVYRKAGVKNVPDINDEAVKIQVRVVFEAIKRVANEDSTGDNR